MMSLKTALEIVEAWLTKSFDGGRHPRRIDLIDAGVIGSLRLFQRMSAILSCLLCIVTSETDSAATSGKDSRWQDGP